MNDPPQSGVRSPDHSGAPDSGLRTPDSAPDSGWFRGALALVLLFGLIAGAGGGLWLTLTISEAGSMLATPDSAGFVLAVNAVAHAVLMGWAGLALTLVAYRTAPTWSRRPAASPRAAFFLCLGFSAAVGACTVVWLHVGRPWMLGLSGMYLAEALLLPALLLVKPISAGPMSAASPSPWRLPRTLLLIALIAGMVTVMAEHDYRKQLHGAGERIDRFLSVVQLWQMPLRLVQLHGLGLCGVLGLALLLRPVAPSPRRDSAAVCCLLIGIVGEVAAWVAYRLSGVHGLAALLLPCWLLIAVGTALIVLPHRLWRPARADAATWFLSAAIAWLGVSLLMLLAWRGYHLARGVAFSHHYMSAFGQAAAVGFIMQGVCALMAQVRALPRDSQLGPFALINAGLVAQIAAFIGMDWSPGPWSTVLAGSGGAIALGLAWWIAVAAVGLRRTTATSAQP